MLAAVREGGDVLLERRPERGVWGGLWCLPEFASAAEAANYARRTLRGAAAQPVPLAPVEHAFTHFDLVITPLLAHCADSAHTPDPAQSQWYRAREPARLGLPAPIRLLLEQLAGAAALQAQLFD
jgi:A/G-specific adenine glycosylase